MSRARGSRRRGVVATFPGDWLAFVLVLVACASAPSGRASGGDPLPLRVAPVEPAVAAEPVAPVEPAVAPPAEAARPIVVAPLTAEAFAQHVRHLASDALAGRETGTVGALRAADYIAGVLAGAGVPPAGDESSFLQDIGFAGFELTAPPRLALGGQPPFEYGSEWLLLRGGPRSGTFPLHVVGGDGPLPPPEPDGALVLIDDVRAAMGRLDEADGWAIVAIAPVPRDDRAERQRPPRPPPARVVGAGDGPVVLVLPGRAATELAVLESDDTLVLEMPAGEAIPAVNVVGVLPGTGTPERPELADEAVVLTAHYDHIGTAPAGPDDRDADRIFNGADDDASGVAMVLELARAIAAGGPPARAVVFLLVTGEEKGLLGTEAYLDAPVWPLERTVANVNFEMVGRPDALAGGPGRMWLTGFELSNLGTAWAAGGLPIVADPRPEQRFFERSDNYAFVRRGVVAQSLSSYGMHDDYHRVSDEADTLDFEHMAACGRVAAEALAPLLSGALEPAWIEPEER